MSNHFAPLSPAEIEEAVRIFRTQHGDERATFCSSGLSEPAKADIKSGGTIDRVVKFLGTDSTADGGFEAYINVKLTAYCACLMKPKPPMAMSTLVPPYNSPKPTNNGLPQLGRAASPATAKKT